MSHTADTKIIYCPHRLVCSAGESTYNTLTLRYQYTPLYGPEVLIDFEPVTLVSHSPVAQGDK